MVDVVEAPLDVPFDRPLIREPTLRFRSDRTRSQEHPKILERAVRGLAGAEPKRDGIEVRLEDRLHDVLHCCLNDAIHDSGDAQGAKLPWVPGLGDQHSSRGAWNERAAAQRRPYLVDESVHPRGKRHPQRLPVYTRRALALVAADARDGHPQVAGVREKPP